MSKKSIASKVVRKSAADVPAATAGDIERLRAAMQGRVDTGDIAERRKFQSIQRDPNGRLPPRKSLIREAIVREMKQRELTAYRLWQMARVHYPALSQSAVHEFLKGQRQLELPSAEALLSAVHLRIVKATAAGNGGSHRKRKLNGKVRVR